MATKETSLRQCIKELSAKNTDYKHPEQVINQAESLKSLSSDLYTDNIRFIYEFVQNADDAEAKNIIFTILEDKYLGVVALCCCCYIDVRHFHHWMKVG